MDERAIMGTGISLFGFVRLHNRNGAILMMSCSALVIRQEMEYRNTASWLNC